MKRTALPTPTLALALGWLAASGLMPSHAEETAPPTATALLNRHFEGTGGRDALSAVKSLSVRGTAVTDTATNEFELSVKSPGLVLFVTKDARGRRIREGRDPRAQFWYEDTKGVRDLDGDAAAELMSVVLALFPSSQAQLAERLSLAVTEAVTLDGREAYAIGRHAPGAPFPRLLFDSATGRMIRVGSTQLEEYRLVAGVMQPHRIQCATLGTLRIGEIAHNVELPENRFTRPGSTGGWRNLLAPALVSAPKPETRLSATGKLEIVRQPPPARIQIARGRMTELPQYDPKSGRHGQVDLRGCDLSGLDLTDRRTDLLHADFDTNTRWPDRMPAGFELKQVIELGQDPGLGVRTLHRHGITGRRVGIGIIDQPLLVTHREYVHRLRLYEEIHSPAQPAQMHGPAVASIAVGRTCGVAPDADLYYIAEQHGLFAPGRDFQWDFKPLAQSIHRLLDVNATLPADRKIRVISISVGWSSDQQGYREAMDAVARATRERVFVVSTSLRETHKLAFDGLDRDALQDPNLPCSYGPGSWWAPAFWSGHVRFQPGTRLCVPMDSRTIASPTGPDDYVHYASAGWSWAVPWVSGLYALACQVDPEITPERFWAEALATGDTITVRNDREEASLGTIANPAALMRKLGWTEAGSSAP